jgi:hypothetical protein
MYRESFRFVLLGNYMSKSEIFLYVNNFSFYRSGAKILLLLEEKQGPVLMLEESLPKKVKREKAIKEKNKDDPGKHGAMPCP